MITGIDLGFGWTKAAGSAEWRQPSVVGDGRELFDGTLKPDDVQLWDGDRHYFIGNLAVRQSHIPYFCTGDHKADSWITRVLMQAALGLCGNDVVDLVTGLPVDYYQSQRHGVDGLIRGFMVARPYRMQVGDRRIDCHPRVRNYKIVPQPFGAAMDYALDVSGQITHSEASRQRILVIDPGYYTLDLLVLDRLEIGKDSRSPAGLGIDTAYNLILSMLRERTGRAPNRQELDRYVLVGEYEGINIIPIRQAAFKALAQQIRAEIDSLNTRFDRYIITGGWAKELAPLLSIPGDKLTVSDGMGNVRGYRKIGVRVWHDTVSAYAAARTMIL